MENAEIGEARKTSNNCEVAKRVPRADVGCFVPSDCIAAIDFGTTNCSVAYIVPVPDEMPDSGPEMLTFDGTHYRVPTAILFDSDGVVDTFGTTARRNYASLEDDDKLECAFFEQIKMDLQHEEVSSRDSILE